MFSALDTGHKKTPQHSRGVLSYDSKVEIQRCFAGVPLAT